MNNFLEQKLWKWKLVAGLLTIVFGGIVLAWPGPTILVASTLFGVYLLLTGFTELFLAFTLPRSAANILNSCCLSACCCWLCSPPSRLGAAPPRRFADRRCQSGSESGLYFKAFRRSRSRSASRTCPGGVGTPFLASSL